MFPVAIVAAAILVPLVTIIYLYDVDVYENEPIRVVALTFLWGALVGALFSTASTCCSHVSGQRHRRLGDRRRDGDAVPVGPRASSRPS